MVWYGMVFYICFVTLTGEFSYYPKRRVAGYHRICVYGNNVRVEDGKCVLLIDVQRA